jgi:Bacteriophage Mu Gam like protein
MATATAQQPAQSATSAAPARRRTHAKETPRQHVERLLESYASVSKKLNALADKAAPLEAALKDVAAELKQVAESNRAELFGTSKTLGLEFGSIGFKLGHKQLVKPLDLNMKWYMQTVEESVPAAVEKTINAKTLIAALESQPDFAKMMAKRGVQVSQKDGFTITLKK